MEKTRRKPNINKLLEAHFAEDRSNFAKADERSNRTELLLKQMGEHLSHLRSDMNVITTTQETHAKESTVFRNKMTDDIAEIKKLITPIIELKNENDGFFAGLKRRGWWIVWLASILTALGVTIAQLKKIL